MKGFQFKYLLPNIITAISIVMGGLAVECALAGDVHSAVWWALYCVLTDKLDGLAARTFEATSTFGMQLDSLADLLSFGVAPAVILYAFFLAHPDLGWASEGRSLLLQCVTLFFVLCAALRLARFNVTADLSGGVRHYVGAPSTFAGGVLCSLFATLLKYGDPSWTVSRPNDWRLLGDLRLDGIAHYLPWVLVLGGVAMVSNLRVPKIGRTTSRIGNALLVANAVVCYAVGIFRWLPEYLALSAIGYLGLSVVYHVWSARAATVAPPQVLRSAKG